jgi:hypothetical protein
VRSGSTWVQQGPKLTGSGELGSTHVNFGSGVALSADGNTALIGGYTDNDGRGAAWVLKRSGDAWTQQGPPLTGTGESGEGGFGWSVALSADGDAALIGGWTNNDYQGAAWVFTSSGGAWAQLGPPLTGTGASLILNGGEFGGSVALSANGQTGLIGGDNAMNTRGAAWVFTDSNAAASPLMASPAENRAAAWAEAHLADPVGKYHALQADSSFIADPNVMVRWSGYCLAFVVTAYQSQGVTASPVVHTDAADMYTAYLKAGLIKTTGVPPRGAFVFYPTDTSSGHIGISVGGGQEISTQGEATQYLPLQEASYTSITGYAGWAYPTNAG